MCLPTHEFWPTSVSKEGCKGKLDFEALIFGFWTDSDERPAIYLMVHLPTPQIPQNHFRQSIWDAPVQSCELPVAGHRVVF